MSLSWNEYYITLAKVTALKSKDPSTKVGAVIVDAGNRVVSVGYNGFPTGLEFPWNKDIKKVGMENTKYPYVIHAEMNAMITSKRDLTGCSIYVTLFPCNECAKNLIQAGVSKVFYECNKYEGTPSGIASKRLMEAAGVEVTQVSSNVL